jgi:hypothetical protein
MSLDIRQFVLGKNGKPLRGAYRNDVKIPSFFRNSRTAAELDAIEAMKNCTGAAEDVHLSDRVDVSKLPNQARFVPLDGVFRRRRRRRRDDAAEPFDDASDCDDDDDDDADDDNDDNDDTDNDDVEESHDTAAARRRQRRHSASVVILSDAPVTESNHNDRHDHDHYDTIDRRKDVVVLRLFLVRQFSLFRRNRRSKWLIRSALSALHQLHQLQVIKLLWRLCLCLCLLHKQVLSLFRRALRATLRRRLQTNIMMMLLHHHHRHLLHQSFILVQVNRNNNLNLLHFSFPLLALDSVCLPTCLPQ